MADARPSDDDIAAALELHDGNVSRVAGVFGSPRTTISSRIRRSARLRQILEDTRESLVDEAVGSLKKAVIDGQGWAVCFTLKTQGKDRGYLEKADLVTAKAVFAFVEDVGKAVGRLGLEDRHRLSLDAAIRKAAAKRFPDTPNAP